jgi:hypothetical protein
MPKRKNRGSKRLTPRQAKLIKELAKGKTQGAAALAAGYSPNNPDQSAHQAMEQIRNKMPQLLDDAGLTERHVIEKYLAPLMNAQETEFAKFKGKITDKKNVVAWGPRGQGLDMYFRLRGSYAPTKIGGGENGNEPVKVLIIDTSGMR